jgi:hypothetical protein
MREDQDRFDAGSTTNWQAAESGRAAVTPSPRRAKARLYEQAGPGGAGRLIERWGLLWRWETWASETPLSRRPRGDWTLTYARAVAASGRALEEYSLDPSEDERGRRFERGETSESADSSARGPRASGIL